MIENKKWNRKIGLDEKIRLLGKKNFEKKNF